jgi:SSS family solute:Na+ symporter
MSCTDTFATSAASCISRDLVQRHLRPAATMKEMLVINRILVIIMITIAAAIALHANSIVDAVIIATVIGTTSYFFPIIGGLYWKRANRWGAMAALIAGGGTQILLISYEQFWLKQPLDSISPYLTEHGVLVGLTLSALCFIGVSLATKPEPDIHLAAFFPEIAEKVFSRDLPRADRESARYMQVTSLVEEKIAGERSHLNLVVSHVTAGEGGRVDGRGKLPWERFVTMITQMHPVWFTPTGSHILYRLSQADMLACVKMVRGDESHIWLSAEPRLEQTQRLKDELFLAYEEIEETLAALGMKAR